MAFNNEIPKLTEAEAQSQLLPTSEQLAIFANIDDKDRLYYIDDQRNAVPLSELFGAQACHCLAPITTPGADTVQVGTSNNTTTVIDQDQNTVISFGALQMTSGDTSQFESGPAEGFYFLNVIADSSGTNATQLFASTTSPNDLSGVLPSGYDLWRHVGMLPVNSTPAIVNFNDIGGHIRLVNTDIQISPGSNSGSDNIVFQGGDPDVDLGNIESVELACSTSNGSGSEDTMALGPEGNAFINGASVPTGGAGEFQINVPTGGTGAFEFLASASHTLDTVTLTGVSYSLEPLN